MCDVGHSAMSIEKFINQVLQNFIIITIIMIESWRMLPASENLTRFHILQPRHPTLEERSRKFSPDEEGGDDEDDNDLKLGCEIGPELSSSTNSETSSQKM